MYQATGGAAGWREVFAKGRGGLFGLICLGVWLNAADTLVVATLLPSVGSALGGYEAFGWATAGFLLGSVLSGAASGLAAERIGLARATSVASLVYASGCVLSALAGDMTGFITGRILQGLGGGALAGLCQVAVGVLFPERSLARVYSGVSSVWGAATLAGPLLGGLFADAGVWRGVFWLFAAQALVVAFLALRMFPGRPARPSSRPIGWLQLGLIGVGVCLIAVADQAPRGAAAAGLVGLGVAVLGACLRLDRFRAARLLPRGAHQPGSVLGAAYATLFLLTASSMGFVVYGPALLQRLADASALTAGYVIASQSIAWTVCGLCVAGLGGKWPARLVSLGALGVGLGVLLCGLAFSQGSLPAATAAGLVLGTGFGMCWAFISQAVIVATPRAERERAAAGATTVRLTGAATGAALASVLAGQLGFAENLSPATAQRVGLWVFWAALPLAGLGVISALRLASALAAERPADQSWSRP